jgi:hypothetical protein
MSGKEECGVKADMRRSRHSLTWVGLLASSLILGIGSETRAQSLGFRGAAERQSGGVFRTSNRFLEGRDSCELWAAPKKSPFPWDSQNRPGSNSLVKPLWKNSEPEQPVRLASRSDSNGVPTVLVGRNERGRVKQAGNSDITRASSLMEEQFPQHPSAAVGAFPEGEEEDPFSFNVSLHQDSFFGFYPMLVGSYTINDQFAFTFYSILWTNPSFSFLAPGGQGLWTEVGAGVSWTLADGALVINPQLGFLNGTLLSGASRPRALEGIVPTLTIDHRKDFTEGQFYMGYYMGLTGPAENHFLHWWINGGIIPFSDAEDWRSIISVGGHYEQLRLTDSRTAAAADIYRWLGPYVQFRLPKNGFLRFTAGTDLEGRISPNFYKSSIGFSF